MAALSKPFRRLCVVSIFGGPNIPAIDLARRCGTLGGGLPAIFNAANEVCVDAFIAEKIGFTAIIETVEEVVQSLGSKSAGVLRDLADVSAIENDARKIAHELVSKVAR